MYFLSGVGIFVLCIVRPPDAGSAYEIPAARFRVFKPQGFEVSIPASDEMTLFAFHGNLNKELPNKTAGTWSEDVTQTCAGRYTFRQTTAKLKAGDVIYYSLYVIHNGLGFLKQNQQFVVVAGIEECAPSLTKLVRETPCTGVLIFEENFDGFDPEKWRIEQRYSSQSIYEFVVYMNHTDTMRATNGKLFVKPIRLAGANPIKSIDFGNHCTGSRSECSRPSEEQFVPVASAQISTLNSFSFIYGRVEVRAILSAASWVFSQLWLQPTGTSDDASGQMRLTTRINKDVESGVLWRGEQSLIWELCRNSQTISNEFHVYSLIWTPEKISFLIDGVETCQYENDEMSPFNSPFHLAVGVGVGVGAFGWLGDEEFNPEYNPWRNSSDTAPRSFWKTVKDEKNWPGDSTGFCVDYIRVYAL